MANRRWEGGAAEETALTAFANRQIEVAEAIERREAVETGDENETNLQNSYCGGIEWVCRQSARSSGQWVGQRIGLKPKHTKETIVFRVCTEISSKDPYIVR